MLTFVFLIIVMICWSMGIHPLRVNIPCHDDDDDGEDDDPSSSKPES